MAVSGKFWVAAALALGLAGCGGGDSNRHVNGELMRPTALDAAQYRAEGVPSNFGDTRPPMAGRGGVCLRIIKCMESMPRAIRA